MSVRHFRRVDGKATRQMSSSGQVRQDSTSECRGVRSSSSRRRVVIVVVVFLSMPFHGRWSGGSRRVRRVDSKATRQVFFWAGPARRVERVSGGSCRRRVVVVSLSCRRCVIVVSSSCCRRRRVALDAFSWQVVGWLSTHPESRRRGDKTNVFCWACDNLPLPAGLQSIE